MSFALDWADLSEDRRSELADDSWISLLQTGYDPVMYFPDEAGKAIPAEGAWILIVEQPRTVQSAQFEVPVLSMWRAREHVLDSGGFTTHIGLEVFPRQAVITTPAGELHLWPHEYVIATNPLGLASEPEATIHTLGGEPLIDVDELFYLQSRGIDERTAVRMLFDKIASFDYAYVTFPEYITSMLAGVAQPLHRHVALNPRDTRGSSG